MGILDTAKEYLGKVKYQFGGSNPDTGFADCSGFTKTVFKKNGYNIGRTTQEQYTKGVEVSKADAKPGDLIFFKNTYDSNYTAGVSHVGIVIGGGNMIDCGSKGVTIRSYVTDYWNEHFLAVKRIEGVDVGNSIDTPTSTPTTSSKSNDLGLAWWGDIVVVVIIVLLVIVSILMLILALGLEKEVLPV